MTILQRRVHLDFDTQCHLFANGGLSAGLYDFKVKDCGEVRDYTTKVQQECPTKDE
jgi:hypothetical protein